MCSSPGAGRSALSGITSPRGKPKQNGYVESFNGRMRDELFSETLFLSLDHARVVIAAWADDYNRERPHSAL